MIKISEHGSINVEIDDGDHITPCPFCGAVVAAWNTRVPTPLDALLTAVRKMQEAAGEAKSGSPARWNAAIDELYGAAAKAPASGDGGGHG